MTPLGISRCWGISVCVLNAFVPSKAFASRPDFAQSCEVGENIQKHHGYFLIKWSFLGLDTTLAWLVALK